MTHVSDLAAFVAASPTSYHAAAEVASRLLATGFAAQRAEDAFDVSPGGHVMVREGAVVSWRVPDGWTAAHGIRIVGSHTDSPALKLKPHPMIGTAGWVQLGVEVYGGPLLGTWLDRELGVAGRLVLDDGSVVLVRTGPVARVPHLAPHLDRRLSESVTLDPQVHMQPVFAVGQGPDVLAYLAGIAGVDAGRIDGFDLFCHPTEAPAVFGPEGEFFASGRLDNLSSVHASVVALMDEASVGEPLAILAAFDHEEVGSSTRTGAGGPLLEEVLTRIAVASGLDAEGYHRLLAATTCLSSDAGHAVHPNYPAQHDPANRPVPNAGPLLKLNAKQRYASDAVGAGIWRRACRAAGVPTQDFVSNNAVPCGSTIGPITATRLGITTVDVGIGLLSMHSARELCGVEDPGYLARAMAAYWAGA